MEENGEIPQQTPVKREIVRRTNANSNANKPAYIPQDPDTEKTPETTASLKTKVVLGAVALGVLAGAAKAIDNTTNAEAAGDEAHVQIVQEDKPAAQAETAVSEVQNSEPDLFNEIFHDLDPVQKVRAQAEVAKFKQRILDKATYQEEHLDIPFQYKDIIEQTAHDYGISVDTLMGLIGTENGGGTDKINSNSGARGVAQFMPETAKQYKLMDDKVDHRGDPVLSIDAAGRYLRDTKSLFAGDEGMALWSYHAGPGNVYTALRIYFYDVNHENINDYGAAITNDNAVDREYIERRTKELIIQDELDISKLLANPKVMEFTATLKDYSETYPATVVAMSQIIKEHQSTSPVHDLGDGLRVSIADKPGSNPFGR